MHSGCMRCLWVPSGNPSRGIRTAFSGESMEIAGESSQWQGESSKKKFNRESFASDNQESDGRYRKFQVQYRGEQLDDFHQCIGKGKRSFLDSLFSIPDSAFRS